MTIGRDKGELDGIEAVKTLEAARVQGALDPDFSKTLEDKQAPLQLDPVFSSPPDIDPRSLALLCDVANRPRIDAEIEFDDTGRATTRQRYRESFSYGHAWPQGLTGPIAGNWELARFRVPRGQIGIVRHIATWADLLGSPDTGPFVPSAPAYGLVSVLNTHVRLHAPATEMPLPWNVAQNFTPVFFVATLESYTGPAPTGDSAFNLGSQDIGLNADDLMPATTMTGLTAVGASHTVVLTGPFPAIPGNSSIWHHLTHYETGSTTAYATITVYGFLQPALGAKGPAIPWVSGSPCGVDPFAMIRNGIEMTWCLRLHQLNGAILREAPGFTASNSRPRGETVEDLYNWTDQRFGFGQSQNVFLVVPEDHYVSLYLSLISPSELASAGLWLGYWAGRLQGYTQASNNSAAVRNVRHGWNW